MKNEDGFSSKSNLKGPRKKRTEEEKKRIKNFKEEKD